MLLALIVLGAARENTRQRVLCIECHCRSKCELRRHDAVENDTAGVIGEAFYVVLGNSRSVRNPIEVDSLVPKSRAHRIQVPDSDARRIELDLCGLLQFGE